MKLAKYNEIILALAGTAVLIALLIAAGTWLLSERESPKPGVMVNPGKTDKPAQNLVFCPALMDTEGSFQYIPVSVVVASDARKDPTVAMFAMQSYSYRAVEDCGVRYGAPGRTFNVLIRSMKTGEQRLLLERPGQIAAIDLPAEKCAAGEGKAPCGWILWLIRSEDTNRDGTINSDDALVAYVSSLDAGKLTALTSSDTTVLASQWLPKTQKWQFQVRRDTNKDGRFTDEDGSDLLETSSHAPALAQPFVQEPIMKALNAVAR